MLRHFSTALALASLGLWSVQPLLAQSGQKSVFEGDETLTFVGDFGQLKGERIEPRTRNVEWRNEDLLVPGNGGLPIRIGRVQPNFVRAKYDNLYLANWDLDIPRIVMYVPPGPWHHGGDHCNHPEFPGGQFYSDPLDSQNTVFIEDFMFVGPLMLSLPGGDSEQMLVKLPSATQFPASAKYVTTNNTYIECPPGGNGFIVHTPDGTTYELTQYVQLFGEWAYGGWGGQITYIPTRITDARGNALEFHYSARTTSGSISYVALEHIVASDGRTVDFHYNGFASGGPKIQKVVFDGKEWNFSYATLSGGATYLTQVTDPVGRSWQYQPSGSHWIVTLPTGASVDYAYQSYCQNGVCGPVVGSRTVSGPNVPAGSVWTYTHTVQPPDKVVTTVSGPSRIVRQTYRWGYNTQVDMRNVFDAGQLLKTEILEPASPNTLLRMTDYVYTVLPQLGLHSNPAGPSVMPFQASPVRVTSQHVTDNLTLASFNTTSTNFDAFGNAQSIAETGTLDRQTNITYRNTTSPWIVGQHDTEEIVGIGIVDRDYLANGLLERFDRYGVVETYEYHATGDLHKKKWVRDTNSHEIVYTNYHRGVAQSETRPEGVSISRVVNATGTIHSQTDGKNYQTVFAYDGANRLSQITPPEGAVTTIQWLSPTQALMSRGDYRQQRSFDGLGRLLLEDTWDQSWGSSGHIYRRKVYDAENRLSFESVPSYDQIEPHGLQLTRDALDRVKSALNTADATTRSYCYDNACRVASTDYQSQLEFGYIETDERGYDTAYEFDAFGDPDDRVAAGIFRQVRTAAEAGGLKFIATTITHYDDGAIDTVSQGGYNRQHIYNPQRQLWKLIEPETGTTELTYDSAGNLKTRKVGTSAITTYTYDGLNRRRGVAYPAPTVAVGITYDKNDNLDVVTSGSVAWDYSFDGLNRLKTEVLTAGGQTFGFTHNYSATGGLESTVYPSGATVTHQPDGLGRPTKVGTYVTLVNYHPNNTPQLIRFGNGQEATMTLTPRRLPDVYVTTDGFRGVLNLNYDYDTTGNVNAITDYVDSSKNRSMFYDGAARLTAANGHWGAGTMTYDDVGNLKTMSLGGTSLTYWYDVQNRLDYTTGGTAYDFSYDVYGNAIGNGFDSYTFNAASQLTAVPSQPGTSYTYDGNGMRAVATTSADSTFYAYSLKGQLLLSKESPSDVTSEYYYLGDRLVAKRDFGAGVDDDLDNDGIVDDVELLLGLNPSNANDASYDIDGDGATNLAEYQAGALLNDADTDNDGMNDGYELGHGLNVKSNDATFDPDSDSLTNLQESQLRTNPFDNDTDNDGVPDNLDPAPTFNPAMVPIINFILEN